jgi:uncharacterized protein with beta-barrel porin domain
VPIDTFTGNALPTLPNAAYPAGKTIFWSEDPRSGEAGYVPVWRSDGTSWVAIQGFILEQTIVLEDEPTFAFSNGNGVTGTGRSTANGTSGAEAIGIATGDGNGWIVNSGTLTVEARPDGSVDATADGDAFGDAVGTVRGEGRAVAIGILTGDGSNRIYNEGAIVVRAVPAAQASTRVTGGDICIWFFGWWCGGGGDGIGKATAVYAADAAGIRVGDGDNTIVNDGTLTVVAAPQAGSDDAGPFTAKVSGDASPVVATQVTSRAVGIETGVGAGADGSNLVQNRGSIDVSASDVPIAEACTGSSECFTSVTAFGVRTGGGDDEIQNTGTITTARTVGGVTSAGTAIDAGGGNDVVLLGDASSASGDVDLGSGDDALNLVGAPIVNGSVRAREGSDALLFDGPGSFASPLQDFERAIKRQEGTYALPGLPTMQHLQVDQGTLQVGGDYAMSPASTFQARVEADGTNGRLEVGGTATLDGNLNVVKGAGYYLDGSEYEILSAGALAGAFASEQLPEPTPLLSFGVEQDPASLRVTASVQTLSSVAAQTGGPAARMAAYLDSLSPSATGEVAEMLGSLQELPTPSSVASALSDLGPRGYADFSKATSRSVRSYVGAARGRMAQIRASRRRSFGFGPVSSPAAGSPLAFGVAGPAAGAASDNAWLADLERGPGHRRLRGGSSLDADGVALGADQQFGGRLFAGVSLGSLDTLVELDEGSGAGATEGLLTSGYGTYLLGERDYVTTVVSLGTTASRSGRGITFGSSAGSAAWSEHSASLSSAFVEVGRSFSLGAWSSEVFGSAHRFALEEDSFAEEGARGLNLVVDSRRTELWQTEVGVRLARKLDVGKASLVPSFELAWLHDLDRSDGIVAGFEGAPGTAAEFDVEIGDADGLRLGTALTYDRSLTERSSLGLSLGLDADLRPSERELSAGARLELRF